MSDDLPSQLRVKFSQMYGDTGNPVEMFFCPGRVNLIGDHIDYNGGNVFPMALERGIFAAARRRTDRLVHLHSLQRSEVCEFDLSNPIVFNEKDGWGNYPKGVAKILLEEGHGLPGVEILFSSNLPMAAGVSSSAALEVLTGYILLAEGAEHSIDRVALALAAQRAEREFVGVNCGIMDQFSVAMSKKDHAVFLNCATLEHRYVPINLAQHVICVINTNKPRELAGSKYNERRGQCESALELLKKSRKLNNLCEADIELVETQIADPLLKRRARHVVNEQQYVLEAVKALGANRLDDFGALLVKSHRSLQHDYEVSCPELDCLVDLSISHPGCLGARMTGAGFGGCAVALVERSQISDFEAKVAAGYAERTGRTADFICSGGASGVCQQS
ncbi:MAG: galactokinase [Oligoflexia bacterium]|nr:galactokinase [Oligoflexia bacterium]